MFEERSEQVYDALPEAQREQLRDFWWAHPYRHSGVEGHTCRYLTGGEGQRLILLAPGGHLPAQCWYGMMPLLESEGRVLALDAPARAGLLDTQRIAELWLAIMAQHEAFGAVIVAHGEAGLAAQWLLRTYPHRVQALMLINSPWLGPCACDEGDRPSHSWLRRPLARHKGRPLSGALMPNAIGNDSPWAAYARALLSVPGVMPGARERLALCEAARQAHEAALSRRGDLAGWRGRCLVVAARDDGCSARQADQLARSLPHAAIRWFDRGGAALPLLYPEALSAALCELLTTLWGPEVPDAAPYLQGED